VMFRESRKSLPEWFISPKLEMKRSSIHGKGIFATERIEAHELIESAPVILIHKDVVMTIGDIFGRITFFDYPFKWIDGEFAFALGWGGVYNHSTYSPNAFWKNKYDVPAIEFYSRCVIEPGEEVTTRYLVDQMTADNLWFISDEEEEWISQLEESYNEER